jgi:hypothetical protein
MLDIVISTFSVLRENGAILQHIFTISSENITDITVQAAAY